MSDEYWAHLSLGECVDKLRELRDTRIALDRRSDEIKRTETALKEYILESLEQRGDLGVTGETYGAKIVTKQRPTIDAERWNEFYDYVANSGRFDLLQRRLNDKAVMDTLAEGVDLPGVGLYTYADLSITKR